MTNWLSVTLILMIGPDTRGAIPMMWALDTASSVRGCRSLKSHARRLKTTARPTIVKLRIRTKKRLNFPASLFEPDSVASVNSNALLHTLTIDEGAETAVIEQNELAWGDLSKYDVIMTGVRAYERRADLRAYNQRLLDYVAAGGTMIVNYNKTEFNHGYGPFPGVVDGSRVNDETVPVTGSELTSVDVAGGTIDRSLWIGVPPALPATVREAVDRTEEKMRSPREALAKRVEQDRERSDRQKLQAKRVEHRGRKR